MTVISLNPALYSFIRVSLPLLLCLGRTQVSHGSHQLRIDPKCSVNLKHSTAPQAESRLCILLSLCMLCDVIRYALDFHPLQEDISLRHFSWWFPISQLIISRPGNSDSSACVCFSVLSDNIPSVSLKVVCIRLINVAYAC
jgi:hypothetical protein